MASLILTRQKRCNLIPLKYAWNSAELEFGLKWGPYENHTQPRTNPHPQGGLGLILG